MKFFDKVPKSVLIIILAAATSFCIQYLPLYYLENWLVDIKFRISPNAEPSGHIALIALDNTSITKLGGQIDFDDHVNFLHALHEENPLNVSYLIDLNEIPGTQVSKSKFVKETIKLRDFVVGINDAPVRGELVKFKLAPPLDELKMIPAAYTADTTTYAEDEVSRRALVWFDGYQFLFPYLANKITGKSWQDYRGQFDVLTSKQVLTDFSRPGSYKIWSMVDVINGTFPEGTFKDKIVLVGRVSQDLNDNLKTPFSRDRYVTSMLEVKANNVDTLIRDRSLIFTPYWVNFLGTFLITIFAAFVVLRMHPGRGIAVIIAGGIAYFVVSWIFFMLFRLNVQTAHPLLLLLICYYFFIPYRLIKETRASWEYQQKNKLLLQVEELKTNFISMMSHDLKTPLARIQGMAEVALKDPQPLSNDQKSAMELIKSSAEDLAEFVTSILDLGRIESAKVKLNLTSKDINQIVEDVCRRVDHSANLKNIRIDKDLEPLFSMRMDVDLMKQVVGNIVENAVKYGKEGSIVTVQTREDGDNVSVTVKDQGIGIPEEELKNIFMKFYRSKNAKQSPIKGTGLGLYLAKEFVTLHNGELSVESVPGEGSTFRVVIPTTL